MIIVENIRKVRTYDNDASYAIVRSLNRSNPIVPNGIVQQSALAPSWGLFKTYRDLEAKGQWNEETFENIYVPKFISDLKSSREAQNLLRDIAAQSRDGKTISLSCFCKNEKLCHRSIIAGILACMDPNIKTENSMGDYVKYYRLYMGRR